MRIIIFFVLKGGYGGRKPPTELWESKAKGLIIGWVGFKK